jgi:hypothetical protein
MKGKGRQVPGFRWIAKPNIWKPSCINGSVWRSWRWPWPATSRGRQHHLRPAGSERGIIPEPGPAAADDSVPHGDHPDARASPRKPSGWGSESRGSQRRSYPALRCEQIGKAGPLRCAPPKRYQESLPGRRTPSDRSRPISRTRRRGRSKAFAEKRKPFRNKQAEERIEARGKIFLRLPRTWASILVLDAGEIAEPREPALHDVSCPGEGLVKGPGRGPLGRTSQSRVDRRDVDHRKEFARTSGFVFWPPAI